MRDDHEHGYSWWRLLLPWEQFVALFAVAIMAPGIGGIYLLSRGRFVRAVVVFALWLPMFAWVTGLLERRGFVRRWVSWPATAAVLLTAAYVFFYAAPITS